MAAHVEGLSLLTLDFPAVAEERRGHEPRPYRTEADGSQPSGSRRAANLILGCDIVVATSIPALAGPSESSDARVVNADLLPTASFAVSTPILTLKPGRCATTQWRRHLRLDILTLTPGLPPR
jgi:indolepyruvate ferredoxin oxidoreductase